VEAALLPWKTNLALQLLGSSASNASLGSMNQLKVEESPAEGYEDDHRIIESSGSEGTPRGHLVQPPCSEQGHR